MQTVKTRVGGDNLSVLLFSLLPQLHCDCLFLLRGPLYRSPGGLTSRRALCPTCLKCGPRVVSNVKSRRMFASLCKALLEREPGTPCPIGSPGGGVGGRGGGRGVGVFS